MKTLRHTLICLAILVLGGPVGHLAAQAQQWPAKTWPAAKPSDVGVDPAPLDALDAEIRAGKHGYVDSITVFRCGKLVYDKSYKHDYDKIYGEQARTPGPLNHDPKGPYNYFNPDWHPFYQRGELHSMQSITKTVTSIVIGVAIARGDFPPVTTPMMKFLDEAKVRNVDAQKRRITIEHLLTMTAGMEWNENLPYNDPKNSADVMEASRDWVQYAVDQPMVQEPGALFNYSSGSSQILSHIFKKATGRDISDYAAEHVFRPMGITHYWKRTPTGLSDTEGGLYLRAHDLAKFGLLFLKGGKWEGNQLLRADWVAESVAPHTTVDQGPVKYGYKWWLPPYGPDNALAWAGSGFGGQRLIVLPKEEMIVVATGWTTLVPSIGMRAVLGSASAAATKFSCAAVRRCSAVAQWVLSGAGGQNRRRP